MVEMSARTLPRRTGLDPDSYLYGILGPSRARGRPYASWDIFEAKEGANVGFGLDGVGGLMCYHDGSNIFLLHSTGIECNQIDMASTRSSSAPHSSLCN
jgi:hypothetical protein